MNTGGKVALGGIILFTLLAVFCTTKLLAVRNTWLTKLEEKQKQLAASAQDLAKARLSVRAVEEEVQALAHLWGDVWPAPNSQPIGQGAIQVGTGGAAGLGAREKAQGKELPVIYAFSMNQQGDTRFQGEFKVVDVQPNTVDARLTRPMYPGESFDQGFYRIRTTLPPSWRTRITELYSERIIADDLLRSQMLQLAELNKHNQDSREILDRRLAELNGTPNPPAGASQQVVDGLVQTLRTIEQERNLVLEEVDRLRKSLDSKYVELRRILSDNVRKVSGSAPSVAPPASASLDRVER